MTDKEIENIINECQNGNDNFRIEHKNYKIYLCELPYDYKRICLYQRNKVSIPKFVNGSLILKHCYVCGRK